MDIDDLIYPLLADSFPEYEEGEVLDIVEEFKMPRGLDNPSEFEQEVWQKYLSLKSLYSATGAGAGGSDSRRGRQPPVTFLDKYKK